MTARVRHPRFDAVIFDLDGVLVDTEPWWEEVRVEFAREHARPWSEEDRAAVMGPNSLGWARIMRERLGLEVPVETILRTVVDGVVARYRARPSPVIEGAPDAVRRLAGEVPVAVASSAHREVIDAAIAALGLRDVFSVVVSSDEVEHGKPAPDVYLEAARRLGADPGRCLVVEDSHNGVRAARAAGMLVVLVPSVLVPPAPGTAELAHAVVPRIADIDLATVATTHDGSRPGG